VRLVYASVASRPLGPEDLEIFAAHSERRNVAAGLTGLLIYAGGRFYGVLEGSQRRVFSRMEEIITEPWQTRLRILAEEEIAAARFRNWSFGRIPDADPGSAAETLERFILDLSRSA
jgi:hypothetical protein